MSDLPEICPRCKKKTEWVAISNEEITENHFWYLKQGLVPPDGLGPLYQILPKKKCSYCNYILRCTSNIDLKITDSSCVGLDAVKSLNE